MKPIKLIINTKSQKYPIFIGENLVSNLIKIAKDNSIKFEKCLLVVDKKIPSKMLFKIRKSLGNKKTIIYNFNANEKNKNQNTINNITELLLKNNFTRRRPSISRAGA